MDGLIVLEQAHAAGLEIRRDGERLVIRGPKNAGETARLVLDNKAAVIENFCSECGEFIDRTGIGWAIVNDLPVHLPCYRKSHHNTALPV